MSLNRDTMKERELNQELSVVIIPNTVYIHETDMNLKINKKSAGKSTTGFHVMIFTE